MIITARRHTTPSHALCFVAIRTVLRSLSRTVTALSERSAEQTAKTCKMDGNRTNVTRNWNTTFEAIIMYGASMPTWLLVSIFVFLLLIIVIGNSLVIIAVVKFRHLRSVNNTFVVSLALVDLLFGVIAIPQLFTLNGAFTSQAMCKVYVAANEAICGLSALHILAINVDRYIAITRPLRYHSLVTHKRAMVTVALLWTVGICGSVGFLFSGMVHFAGCVPVYTETASIVMLLAAFLIPLIAITIIYACIFRLIMKHLEFMRQAGSIQGIQSSRASVEPHSAKPRTCNTSGSYSKSKRRSLELEAVHTISDMAQPEQVASGVSSVTPDSSASVPNAGRDPDGRKTVKMISLILGIFTLAWGMFYILTVIETFSDPTLTQSVPFLSTYFVSIIFLYVSSSANPIIYGFFKPEFKQAFRKLLHLQV